VTVGRRLGPWVWSAAARSSPASRSFCAERMRWLMASWQKKGLCRNGSAERPRSAAGLNRLGRSTGPTEPVDGNRCRGGGWAGCDGREAAESETLAIVGR